MKLRRGCIFLLCTVLLGLFMGTIQVNAMNTGFAVEPKPLNEKNTFISNVNISLLEEEPVKASIACFDINGSGFIAIGQSKSEKKTIGVYSNEGIYQYGYTFNCSGSFGLEWDEKNLNIYFVRSDVIVSVAPNGEILDVVDVQETKENNLYKNHLLYATERTIGDREYIIKNDMGIFNLIAPSYSQIVVRDIAGEECVIYDVNEAQLSKMITILVIILVLVSTVVVAVVRNCMKLMRGTGDG